MDMDNSSIYLEIIGIKSNLVCCIRSCQPVHMTVAKDVHFSGLNMNTNLE